MLTASLLVLANSPLLDQLTSPSAEPVSIVQVEVLTGDTYFQQGWAAFQMHEYAIAIAHWQQALKQYRAENDTHKIATTLNAIAAANLSLGEYDTAIAHGQDALTLAEDLADPNLQSQVLGNLGIAYLESGRYSLALNHYEQALAIMRSQGDISSEAQLLGLLGNAYEILGNYDAAIATQSERLRLAETLNAPRLIAPAQLSLGNLHRYQQDYETAIDRYTAGIALARAQDDLSTVAYGLDNLGIAYQQQGQSDQAIAAYTESIQLAQATQNPSLQASTLLNLSVTQAAMGDGAAALQSRRDSVAIARRIEDPRLLAIALNNFAHSLLNQGNLATAEAALAESITLLDDLRQALTDADKITLFDTQVYTYNLLVQVYVAQGDPEAALIASEKGRAQALIDLVRTDAVPSAPSLVQMKQIAQTLNTTLVEYALVPEDEFVSQGRQRGKSSILYVWVITPDGNLTFRQQSLSDVDLSELVTDTRQVLGVRGDRAGAPPTLRPEEAARRQAEIDQNLKILHNLLISPIADLLPSNPDQQVTFIPQGELFLVPFPALKDANGTHLIEHHTMLTASSIQVLQLTRDLAAGANSPPRLHNGNALIIGNPTMPTVTFLSEDGTFREIRLSPLFGAEREAIAIADFLNTPALTGNQATETTVKQQLASADLIHLATHGLLEYGNPRETGSRDTPGAIALAPGNGEDGLLTAREILAMDLQADLVVLSACDTGRGRITGDGVVGLSRSFIAAGVPSIVVSLWAVPDAPTAELMTEFYAQLDQGQSKAQALRQAMLMTKAQHPEPKSWAAFTLIGAGQ